MYIVHIYMYMYIYHVCALWLANNTGMPVQELQNVCDVSMCQMSLYCVALLLSS